MGTSAPIRRHHGAMLVVGLCVAIAACAPTDGARDDEHAAVSLDSTAGGDTAPSAAPSAAPAPGWSADVLSGEAGADVPALLMADGGQAAAVLVSDEGRVQGFATDEDGRFRAGTPIDTGIALLRLGGLARSDGGWVALGSGEVPGPASDGRSAGGVVVLASSDGLSWRQLDVTGLDGLVHVTGVAATSRGGLLGVGLRATQETGAGDVVPATWHSEDGSSWTMVPLPSGAPAGVEDVALVGDRVVAVGSTESRAAVWTFDEDEVSWTAEEPPGLPGGTFLGHIAVVGGVAVVSGVQAGGEGAGRQVLLRSTDDGRSWHPVETPPPPVGDEHAAVLVAGDGRFLVLRHPHVDPFTDAERCYADIALCRGGPRSTVHVSEDGVTWRRVDISDLDGGEEHIDGLAETAAGVVAYRRVDAGLATWTWSGDVPLPIAEEPAEAAAEVEVLDEEATPEPGRRYAMPLYIHCGMDWLYVAGEPWQRMGGRDVETGAGDAVPPGWPVSGEWILGFVTLVDDDRIEYSLEDGTVIATYAPAREDPPGCA